MEEKDKLRFQCFATGSSGNCYYIGNYKYGILIDAGIGVRTIRKNLRNLGLDFHNIRAVFVTHDHSDHIRAVGTLGEKYHIPVYTTEKVHEGIHRSYCVTEKLYGSKRVISVGESVRIEDLRVQSFPVSHDATDCIGYTVEYQEKKITFATDLGHITPEVAVELRQADYMVLEANYDEDMLRFGPYPRILQDRIRANTGHLSNDQAGIFLAENCGDQTKRIFLCHISKENNSPEVAFNTVWRHLEKRKPDTDVELVVLERLAPSQLYTI